MLIIIIKKNNTALESYNIHREKLHKQAHGVYISMIDDNKEKQAKGENKVFFSSNIMGDIVIYT